MVRLLLEWDGKRMNSTKLYKNHILHHAACNGRVEVVRLLLAWVGVDGQRLDIEVARRAADYSANYSAAVLAVCDEAASIAAWWSPARVAWMISVVTSG